MKERLLIMGLVLIQLLHLGCEKDFEFDEGPQRIVVECWITDQPGPFQVKISSTQGFGNPSKPQGITGASVLIRDDLGQVYQLIQDSIPGEYATSEDSLQAEQGRSYQLEIGLTNGHRYISTWESLLPVASLEKLETLFEPGFIFNQPVRITYTDPSGRGNYYRWKIFLNNQLIENLILDDDRLADGNQRQFNFGNFPVSSVVRVEQHSLTSESYDFLALIISQKTEVGQTFGVPAAPIIGNLSNPDDPRELVLGYFGVSAVSSKQIIIGF